jgi:hypothetical protein
LVTTSGHIVDPKDREAVLKLKEQTPRAVGDVRKLMGFIGYYRSYIPDFPRKAKPIYDLLKENREGNSEKKHRGRKRPSNTGQKGSSVRIQWDTEHQEILEDLFSTLLSPPVLAYPNFHKPYTLHIDASQRGLGAILYQNQDDGKLAVVAYASRTLTPAEENYHLHSGKLEFLALKWDVTEGFQDYLYYASFFDVYSDYNPLRYIFTAPKLDATRLRWVSQLADFRFHIHYKPGVKNGDADGLSRMPLDTTRYTEQCSPDTMEAVVNAVRNDNFVCTSIGAPVKEAERKERCLITDATHCTVDKATLLKAQQEDPDIGPLLSHVKEGKKPTRKMIEGLTQAAKYLLREWPKLRIANDILKREISLP